LCALSRSHQDADAAAPSVAAGTGAGVAAARSGSKKKWDEAAETQVICEVCMVSVWGSRVVLSFLFSRL
jgi:hypothetical protein